jgi:hypothetical protein
MNTSDDLTRSLRLSQNRFNLNKRAADEIEKLRELLYVFDNHFICEECERMAATYIDTCQNPLHRLHDYLYDLEGC